MKQSSAAKIMMPSVNDLFINTMEDNDTMQVVSISLSRLKPFKNHHFKVVDDERMIQLMSSIKNEGVLNPIVVRKENDGYEILSGHRRVRASTNLGLKTIPAIIKHLSDTEAELLVIESNIQRDKKLPSELAYNLKRECEIRKHTGLKSTEDTDELIGKIFSLSPRKVSRMIRLTELDKLLLEYVDDGKIGTSAGEMLSYLSLEEQRKLALKIKNFKVYPNLNKAKELKEASKTGSLNDEMMDCILSKESVETKKTDLSGEWIDKYFSKDITDKEREEIICEALKEYFERRS